MQLRDFFVENGKLMGSYIGITIPPEQIKPLRNALRKADGALAVDSCSSADSETGSAVPDATAYLLIAMFQQAVPRESPEDFDAGSFLARHELEITEAGQVLAYLGLATPNIGAALGWHPTHQLLDIIAKRLLHHKPQAECANDELTIHLLRDAVFGDDSDGKGTLAFRLLHQLGVVQVNDDGYWSATGQLQRLFENGYYRHHLKTIVPKEQQNLDSAA